MKKMNNKGFTLMEVLIVVAIIAVLIAIAIPVFTGQLEKARDAVSVANLRSAYAEAQVTYLLGDTGNAEITGTYTGTGEIQFITVSGVVFKGKTADSFSGLGTELPFTPPHPEPAPGTKAVKFEYNKDGSIKEVTVP